MGRIGGEGLEQAAEMKGAHIAMFCYFSQRNIICKMFCHVFFGPLDGDEVVLLQPGIDPAIGFVIGNVAEHLLHHLHHHIIYLQFAACPPQYKSYDIKVQELGFGIGLNKGGMQVIVLKEFIIAVMLQQRCVEIVPEFEDGAFIGDLMGMGNSTFIARFVDKHTTIVTIQ